MPDFRLQQSFPIASVIDAAGRNAQLQEQAREAGNKSLLEGLQSIGQIGQSLYDTKKRVAQSLALGRQFDIPDDVAKGMDPDQLLKVGTIKKGQIDMATLLNLLHPGAGGSQANATSSGSATPAAQPTTPKSNGAMLASDVTATPIPGMSGGLPPATTGSMSVPIQAPPTRPASVNSATMNAALKIASANRQEPVMTQADALSKGSVQHGTHIVAPKGGDTDVASPVYQGKLEKEYRNLLTRNLSNRSGGLGLQDSKVNQAVDLRRIVNKFYDAKTGKYNIPPSQHAELVLGLARLVSPTGQIGIELMHELKQRTAREGVANTLIYLGMDPAEVGGPNQDVAKLFVDSIDRQGATAEELRQGYIDEIHSLSPIDLEEKRRERMDKVRLGNSFNDALAKSPDRQSAAAASMGTTYSDSEKEKRYQEWKRKQSL